MAKTTNVYVDTTKILNTLAIFDNLENELNEIKNLSDISNTSLIPNDFYNGCNINNKNISEENSSLFSNYVNVINNIKKYILELEQANEKGSFSNNNNNGATTSVTGLTPLASVELINDLDNANSNIENGNTTISDELISEVNDDMTSVSLPTANTGDGVISNVSENDGKSSIIDEVSGNKVVETIVDASGKVVAVATISDGKKIWYQVVNGKVIIPIDVNGNEYKIDHPITIIDNGNNIEIKAGNYEIEQIICYEDGRKRIIKINCGNYHLLLNFDRSGNIIKIEYIKQQTGVFTINNTNYDRYDMYGNIIGKFGNGEYYIYETKYDQNGNIIGFSVSPDGEYEEWIYINENTKDNEYSLVTSMQNNNKTNVSLFEQNKGLFGLLGILFVALGVTVTMKIKKNKKDKMNQNDDDEDYDINNNESYEALPLEEGIYHDNAISEWEEKELSTGNYPIYDIKQDEDGLVTEARISPDDSDDEYWVEI